MRLSKRFGLNATQYELDFVDIDTSKDHRLFLDPHFLSLRTDRWSIDASTSVRSFFGHFLDLLRAGRREDARRLFSYLSEPNDTCLGMSRHRPRGSGIGDDLAQDIFDSLVGSKAVATGVLTDLEDTRVFVRGVDRDRVSDMTTALIRLHLLNYTVDQCTLWNITLTPDVPSGDVWDATTKDWTSYLTPRLVVAGRPILLVPKAIVSYARRYAAAKYHRHFVLNYLKNEHLRLDTILVQKRRRRDGSVRRWVTKKSIIEHESPGDKDYLAAFTDRHPEVFRDFKQHASLEATPLPDTELTNASLEEVVAHLLGALKALPPGNDHATAYHKLVAGILELCFYPALIAPRLEVPINQGRKRIDITFDNAAVKGLFHRLHQVMKIPSAYIMVECKNYSRDVANPELDQLTGRFSVNRGRVGILVSRSIDDFDLIVQRCADTYKAGGGLLIPIDDGHLMAMLEARATGVAAPFEDILSELVRRIVMA